uniref:Uncharacterized protein n=1 Tax=Arion vulgaris TaxID=1028688 RepID=A0A0B6YAV2_9EUPU
MKHQEEIIQMDGMHGCITIHHFKKYNSNHKIFQSDLMLTKMLQTNLHNFMKATQVR